MSDQNKRRLDYFYFIVDVSYSMTGRRLGVVNESIISIVNRLKRMMKYEGIEARVILQTFSEDVEWSAMIPQSIERFVYHGLNIRDRASNLKRSLLELNTKMQRQYEVQGDDDSNTTVILYTDGLSTDSYSEAIDLLNKNPLFTRSNRIGVTFRSPLVELCTKKVFVDFCGTENNVIIEDFALLNQLIFDRYV